jgi:hypothetical protein
MKRYPCNRPWRPIRLWDVDYFRLSRQSAHRWQWGCQPYAPAALYSTKTFLSASGTHFCQMLSDLQGLVRLEGLGKLKKFEPVKTPHIQPTFRRNVSPPTSGLKNKLSKKQAWGRQQADLRTWLVIWSEIGATFWHKVPWNKLGADGLRYQ